MLDLNIEKMPVTKAGISPFYWPVSIDELGNIRKVIVNDLIAFAQELKSLCVESSDLFYVIFLFVLKDAMEMAVSSIIHERCKRDGYQLNLTPRNRLLNILQRQQFVGPHPIVDRLKSGPSPLKKLRLPARVLRDLVKGYSEGICRRRLLGINFKTDIISMEIGDLAQYWAKKSKKKITYLRENYWFKPVLAMDGQLNGHDHKTCEDICDTLRRSFLSLGIDFPKIFEAYLKDFIQKSFLLTRHHINFINRKNIVPKYLWSKTGGSLWARILSKMVKNAGGEVTRFDHAGGTFPFLDTIDMGPRELDCCDDFITYSSRQAEHLQKYFSRDKLIHNTFPKIHYSTDWLHVKKLSKNMDPLKQAKEVHPKTIMYVSTEYPGEDMYVSATLLSDMTLLDWTVRLFAQLEKWQYRIIFKPHPAGAWCSPMQIKQLFGPIVNNKPFEEVLNEADVLILDAPFSTTFNSSIISGKPIVFVDFGLTKIEDEMRDLLNRRCAVVHGRVDENAQAHVSWEALQDAIASSCVKKDMEIAKEYFNVRYC